MQRCDSKFPNNFKNFAIFQDNFVKYELRIKVVSNSEDGILMHVFNFLCNCKFSNNFLKFQVFQENIKFHPSLVTANSSRKLGAL